LKTKPKGILAVAAFALRRIVTSSKFPEGYGLVSFPAAKLIDPAQLSNELSSVRLRISKVSPTFTWLVNGIMPITTDPPETERSDETIIDGLDAPHCPKLAPSSEKSKIVTKPSWLKSARGAKYSQGSRQVSS
jgi:hypothetical protein